MVSAIIPARDAADCLARAIDSALAQSYRPLEVIVVDDGSQDATAEVAAHYGKSVRLVRLPEPRGPAAARNAGIAAAGGAYLAYLDADDEWFPEKISRQMAMIERSPGMSFVYCGAAYARSSLRPPTLVNPSIGPAGGRDFWKALLARAIVCTPTVLARRQSVLQAGMFDPELPTAEDQDLWIRLARIGEVGYVNEVLARVHDTPGSLTKLRAGEGILHMLKVVDRHVRDAAGELTAKEIRAVYAERYASLGRDAFQNGFTASGLRLLFLAVWFGQPALPMFSFALAASRLGHFVKRALRRRHEVHACGSSTGQGDDLMP